MKPILGILLGDATGIGPELIAKMCAEDKFSPYCRPIIIGDKRVLEMGKRIANVDFPIQLIDDISMADWDGSIAILDQNNLDPQSITRGKVDANSGRVTGADCITAMELCKKGQIKGIMYAPFNKAALILGGHNFECEHHLFAHYFETQGTFGEMNVLNNLWTSRVTSHIPLKDVVQNLNSERVLAAIKLAYNTLTKAGFESPRIAVAAINPHGGESGLCGREEIDIIAPGVQMAKDENINAMGPFPSDTLFINAFKGDYDAVVTMYHDQGQIAIKLMGFQFGVTVAAGQPYPVATPAHGTAFDIVGKGIAKTSATENALILTAKMAGWTQN
ncbi:MAG: 4-hydroxythreonine-4-phosphate dehydrogenase [Clostridiaceae bacterium BRH_c20a]|nr:MAG: 4-hydroxythreonine-4-phosphate dehydrogenase [Clostridiaceae bacterium BRH_c20a]